MKYIEGEKVFFPIPVNKSKILKPGMLKGIIKGADVSVERLTELLRQ